MQGSELVSAAVALAAAAHGDQVDKSDSPVAYVPQAVVDSLGRGFSGLYEMSQKAAPGNRPDCTVPLYASPPPPPPAAAQGPVAVKAEDIEVIEEVVGGYDWLGTGSSYDHAGKREAEQAWSRIRSALSTSKSAPAPEIARDCGIDGGSLTEHQDCIGKAYTESLARGLMFEARISLIAMTIRNSLRKYGHKTAESVLPECIAADVERTLVAANAAEATERAPEIAALRAENERLKVALPEELTGKLQWAMHDAFAHSKADTIAGRMIDVYAAVRRSICD